MTSYFDDYGFSIPKNTIAVYTSWTDEYRTVLNRRIERWDKNFPNEHFVERNSVIQRFVRKGIPQRRRAEVWLKTSGAGDYMLNNDDLYERLVEQGCDGVPEATLLQIEADLPRTFPEHLVFQDLAILPLKRVLIATAKHVEDVGYCQGMNLIAGMLLLAVCRSKQLSNHSDTKLMEFLDIETEKHVFFLLVIAIRNILEDYFTPKMNGLLQDLDAFEHLLLQKDRNLTTHLRNYHLPLGAVVSKWFVTAFANCLPSETVFRLWDIMFYDGIEILFSTALNLISLQRHSIRNAKDSSSLVLLFDSLTDYSHVTVNCHHFFSLIFRRPIKSKVYVSIEAIKKVREKRKTNELIIT